MPGSPVLSVVLVVGGILLVAWLQRVVLRVALRKRWLAAMEKVDPQAAAAAREPMRRAIGTWRAGPRTRFPKDPRDLSTHVLVPPFGDGRPGWHLTAPGPARPPQAELGPDGSRQDAALPITPSIYLLVVGFGRIGSSYDGYVRPAARQRAIDSLRELGPGQRQLGEIERVATGAGEGWRVTRLVGRTVVADTHIDRGEWAYVVGVVSQDGQDARALELANAILDTFAWIDTPSSVPEA